MQRRGVGDNLGGTMRLGAYPCVLEPGSLVVAIYGGAAAISERHRHRYEVNINYRPVLEEAGLRFSGMSPDGRLPEMVELPGHPWFVGVQFHPGAEVAADGAASPVRRLHPGGRRAVEAGMMSEQRTVQIGSVADRQPPAAGADRRALRHREPASTR